MNDRLPKREEVPAEMTWRLEDIYPDEVLWEKELEEAKELAQEQVEKSSQEDSKELCSKSEEIRC